MTRFPIGEALLPSLTASQRAHLVILAEAHAAAAYAASAYSTLEAGAHEEGGHLDHAALFDAAAAVASAWGHQAPSHLSAQDVTSVAGAYLSEHPEALTLTPEGRAHRTQRRAQEAAELEAAALVSARGGDYAHAAVLLENLLSIDPTWALSGGRSVVATRDAMHRKAEALTLHLEPILT